jgi:hypothetical protein
MMSKHPRAWHGRSRPPLPLAITLRACAAAAIATIATIAAAAAAATLSPVTLLAIAVAALQRRRRHHLRWHDTRRRRCAQPPCVVGVRRGGQGGLRLRYDCAYGGLVARQGSVWAVAEAFAGQAW